MSRSRFSILCSLACALILAVPLAIAGAVERAAAVLWSWIAPAFARLPALPFDFGDRMVAFAGDCPADPATLNSLRHEAGMRRLT